LSLALTSSCAFSESKLKIQSASIFPKDYTENVRKNKPKTTKPQSEKSKLTPSNIVKPKQKRQND
jgi:hypothetical protein